MSIQRGLARNCLEYTGVVRLSQYINNKKMLIAESHNAGGSALFNFLSNCLTGDFDLAKYSRPDKILLLKIDKVTGSIEKASNTSFIQFLTRPERIYGKDSECIIRYSFVLPQEYFAGTEFNAVGLYPQSATELDIQDYSAICTLTTDNWNISRSSVLLLDWDLRISN